MSSILASWPHLITPLLFATILVCPLYGITIAQSIWYFRHYRGDSKPLKCWIAMLLIVDGIQTFSLIVAAGFAYPLYQVIFDNFNSPPYALLVDVYASYLTITMVQIAYTYRVYVVSGGITLIGMTWQVYINHTGFGHVFGTVGFSSTVACDLLISASLAYYLNKARPGIERMENLIDRLILYIVGIGALTIVFTLITFITWLVMSDKIIYIAFLSVGGKVAVNCLLVTLNARKGLRAVADENFATSALLSTLAFRLHDSSADPVNSTAGSQYPGA